jgi:N-acetyl-1-D-myo-inositol-2-amino-2-deoxy-alpha-D-glucopyranoside deacetylase
MSKSDGLSRAGQRLLLVHAHPDDESIGTGATMAKYAAEGAGVTLVTCTLGELGEVIPPELAHLAWDAGGGLGQFRIGELAAACRALGVSDHRFLGGAGRWRDSGMMGVPSNDWPGCFWRADLDEAAGELVKIIEQVRPQVLVSYDDNGFYGHPDHIQAHRVAWRAFELAGGLVSKFYATAVPRSVLAEAMAVLPRAAAASSEGGDRVGAGADRVAGDAGQVGAGGGSVGAGGGSVGAGGGSVGAGGGAGQAGAGAEQGERTGAGSQRIGGADFSRVESVDDLPFGTADEKVTTAIDARDYLDAKLAAMRAHATQISVDSPFFALSNNIAQQALGVEYYTLVAGPTEPGYGSSNREPDLFAGLA